MDLSDDVVQSVLNNSISIVNKKFGYFNNKIYQFMNEGAGVWHGFIADYAENTTKTAIYCFKTLDIINNKTAKRLCNGK